MKVHTNDDDSPPARNSTRSAPDFTSRATKLRLMSLFAALILVLIAMKEAGKPERWEWLGFDKTPNKATVETETASLPNDVIGFPSGFEPTSAIESGSPKTRMYVFENKEEIQQFWTTTYAQMELDRQRCLFRLLRIGRNGGKLSNSLDSAANAAEKSDSYLKVVRRVEFRRSELHSQMLNEISLLPNDSEHKRNMSDRLVKFQDNWKASRSMFDALLSGNELTPDQIKTADRIQSLLDEAAFKYVADHTPVTRANDGPAWLRAWEEVQTGAQISPKQQTLASNDDAFEETLQIQLVSQPRSYRGRWVTVRGTVMGVERLTIRKNELGIEGYYVLWVRPGDTNNAPYCVYSLSLPEGFPEIGPGFNKVAEAALIKGVFFKLRSYQTTEREMTSCPLILADGIEPISTKQIAAAQRWVPPAWQIYSIIAAMPLLAGFIAIWVYQSTRTRLRDTGKVASREIDYTLGSMTENPDILSVSDRIQKLYDED